MRHKRVQKKFGRSKAHRELMMASLVANLILRDRIRTTLPKAKQARRDAEKMVTLARKGLVGETEAQRKAANVAYRRLAAESLRRPEAVARLFEKVVPAMEGRKGGYTRIVKLGQRRSDGSWMAVLEWVAGVAAVPATSAPAADSDAAAAKPADEKVAAAKA